MTVPLNLAVRGAPVLNDQGRVIGVYQGMTDRYPELSRACTMSAIRRHIDEIFETGGSIRHASIGLGTGYRGRRGPDGVALGRYTISEVVPGLAEEAAGLKPGDVLVSINGVAMQQSGQFWRFVLDSRAGQRVTIVVERDEEIVEVAYTLPGLPEKWQTGEVPELATREGHGDGAAERVW